jgi:DNA-directed RNA polymerase specialized sigma24 family protein
LKYVENRKVAEIAAMLGQSEKAIESLLSRSRQAFRKVFLRKAKDAEIEESGLLK